MRRILVCVALALAGCGGGGGNDAPSSAIIATQSSASGELSGTVISPSGAAIAGVQLTLSGTNSSSTVSDAAGAYRFGNLTSGSYVVTASAIGASFTPPTILVAVTGQTAGNLNFVRTPQSYASTQLIANYTATLHSQMLSKFVADENVLGSTLASQGAFFSGLHYAQSGQNYVSLVQGFASGSLAFVKVTAQTMAIDKDAVTTLFSSYASQDAAYAGTYYGSVPWGLTGTGLATFIAGNNKSTSDIYALVVLQLP